MRERERESKRVKRERQKSKQAGRQGEKARQHGVLTPPPDDFERFVLLGSAESPANAAG